MAFLMADVDPRHPHPASDAAIVARLRAAGCVFAEDEARLLIDAATSPGHLESMVADRESGLPLEPILGWVQFAGLRLDIDPGVFVPRVRTELLVIEAVALAGMAPVVVDLCCGCGAVGTAVATTLLRLGVTARLYASDIEPAAVVCARRNVGRVGGDVFEGDLFSALPPRLRGTVDLLVVNAPYVPTDAIAMMPPEARDFEPLVALDGGGDGLDVHRRIALGARDWLAPGGHLLIESSREQSAATAALFAAVGLQARIVRSDDLDATVVVATAA